MATYTKRLLTLTITTVRGATYTITDTESCPYASQALNSIRQGQSFFVSTDDGEFLITPWAVESAKIEYSESDPIDIPTPCDDGNA